MRLQIAKGVIEQTWKYSYMKLLPLRICVICLWWHTPILIVLKTNKVQPFPLSPLDTYWRTVKQYYWQYYWTTCQACGLSSWSLGGYTAQHHHSRVVFVELLVCPWTMDGTWNCHHHRSLVRSYHGSDGYCRSTWRYFVLIFSLTEYTQIKTDRHQRIEKKKWILCPFWLILN